MKVKRILVLVLVTIGTLSLLSISLAAADGAPGKHELRPGAMEAGEPAHEAVQITENNMQLTPEDAGGPDDFGYTYMDSNEPGGPVYDWVDIMTSGITISFDNLLDDRDGPFALGFPFNFYGTVYSDTWVGSNGWLTIGANDPLNNDFSSDCPLPDTTGIENLVAAHWDDLHLSPMGEPTGTVKYEPFAAGLCPYNGYGGACFVVQWDTYHNNPAGPTDPLSFEAILFDNDDMLVQIEDAGSETGAASTTGIENADGSIGLTYGACHTSGHITDTLAVRFQFPPPHPRLDSSYKTGSAALLIGDPLTYTVVLTNSGNITAVGTVLTDPLPVDVTFVSGSLTTTSGIASFDGSNVTWAGDIAVGSGVTISFVVDTSGVTCGSQILNSATVYAPGIFPPVNLNHSTSAWHNRLFFTDFEADNGGFVADPISEWQWGVPTYPLGIEAYSPVNVWGTDLTADADDAIDNHLLTKTVTMPGTRIAGLNWWDWYGDEASDERHVNVNGLEIWNDNGGTDQRFWMNQLADLSAFGEQTIDIIYDLEVCCSSPGPDGWYIDDVTIFTCDTPFIDADPAGLQSTQFADEVMSQTLTISNTGAITVAWTIDEAPGDCAAPADLPWLSNSPGGGSTPPASNVPVEVDFDSTGIVTGTLTGNLCISSDDFGQPLITVPVTLTVEGQPEITVDPVGISRSLFPSAQVTVPLTISNVGTAALSWMLHDTPAMTVSSPAGGHSLPSVAGGGCDYLSDVPWLSAVPVSGTISSGSSSILSVTLDSATLMTGTYTSTLCIDSNALTMPLVQVPVTLTVEPINEWFAYLPIVVRED